MHNGRAMLRKARGGGEATPANHLAHALRYLSPRSCAGWWFGLAGAIPAISRMGRIGQSN
jgi:hypothetical protein